jgi:preprotein translocase SecE subunit
MFAKVRKFVTEVSVELRKVSWSTKKELIDSTWIVMLSSAFLGIFIATMDTSLYFVLSNILGLAVK